MSPKYAQTLLFDTHADTPTHSYIHVDEIEGNLPGRRVVQDTATARVVRTRIRARPCRALKVRLKLGISSDEIDDNEEIRLVL